jgi:hypothetical protein
MAPILLTLADKSIQKAIADNQFKSLEAINLYLLILDISGKHDVAIDVLNKDAGSSG